MTAGTAYSYEIEAFNGMAASPNSNTASATIPYPAPAAPTNLAATAAASPASVSLSWTDNASNATCYMVVRSIGTTGAWTLIATNLPGSATNYADERDVRDDLQLSGRGVRGHGGVALLERGVGHTASGGADEPGGQGLRFGGERQSVVDRQRHRATCYMVVRSIGTTGVWGLIATNLPGTATSYTDKNVTAGTTYNYQVVAFAGTVASPFSSRGVGHGAPGRADESRRQGLRFIRECQSLVDQQRQRDFLHRRAVQRHDGRLDRRCQQPSRPRPPATSTAA